MLPTSEAPTAPVPASLPYRAAIALACLVALVLRVLYATRSGLWRDEALFLFVARSPTLADVLAFLQHHESHPPLFYLLERGWQAVFGASDAAALALPVLLGVALVPAVAWVGRQVFSARAGLLAAALVAVSPILAEHAALVRPYSFMPLVTLFATYALWRGLVAGGPGPWVAYALLAATMLLTHNYAVVILAALALVGLAWLALQAGEARPRALLGFFAAHAGALVLYAAWLPSFWYQLGHAGHAPHPVSSWSIPAILAAKTFSSIPNPVVGGLVLLVVAGLAVRAYRQGPPEGSPVAYRLGFWLFGLAPLVVYAASVVGSAYSDLLWPRTLLMVVPCLLLVLVEGLVRLVPAVSRGGFGVLVVALAGGYLAIAVFMLALPKSNAREIAHAVAERIQPGDLVVISPEWLASGFNYYFTPANPQIDFPNEGREGATPFDNLAARIGDPTAFQRVKRDLAAQRQHGGRVWLIADKGGLLPGLPPGDEIPPDVPPTHWNGIGVVRTSQIARELQRLYGRPTNQIATPGESNGAEDLTAILYAPPTGPQR